MFLCANLSAIHWQYWSWYPEQMGTAGKILRWMEETDQCPDTREWRPPQRPLCISGQIPRKHKFARFLWRQTCWREQMLSWCKSALVCKSITVPRTSQFYVRGKSSPHGSISVSCQSQWVLSFRSGSTPVNSLRRAAAKLLLRSCSSDVTAQPGGRSPKEPLAAASIVHHPSDLTQEQTSLGSLPPSWRGLSRKQKPPAQENISVIKGLACSLRMLPFLSVAAELMYYSHSPSCPDMSLAGSFLYCASLGEKVGLGCASAPINQNSSVSSVLQPGSWLPFAFFFFFILICYSETDPDGSPGLRRDPLSSGQSPVRQCLLGAASACPATGDTAVMPPRTLQKQQRHLPGNTGAQEKGVFPF